MQKNLKISIKLRKDGQAEERTNEQSHIFRTLPLARGLKKFIHRQK